MNVTMRKLAMLEKSFIEQEEKNKIVGYTQYPVDKDLKNRITLILDKVRAL